MEGEFKIANKARFWLGIALVIPEIVILLIYGLSFIDWSFVNLTIIAVVLYNVIAGILIWNGSRVDKK